VVAKAGDDSASQFDVAFGAAVTTDYLFRGISQTDGGPAVQGYVEFDYDLVYAGVWASNVDFGTPDAEIDLSLGIRPEVGPAAFDLGYVQYLYADGTSPSYGELYAMVDYTATDSLTLGAKTYFAPDYAQEGSTGFYGEANIDYALPANFGVSAAVGYQSFADSAFPDYWTWNAGVYWTWKDLLTLDLRYSGSDLSDSQCAALMSAHACGSRVMATLSLDTAWSSLTGK